MQVAVLAYSSAMVCVVTRGLLSVIDRSVFKREEVNFTQIIFLNAILPFIVSLLICCVFYSTNNIFPFLFETPVILNALGAQAAATAFSHGFKNMTVRNITASAKVADLLIPILIFALTRNISLKEYIFSCLSVVIFIPIFLNINKSRDDFCLKSALIILSILLFQAGINVLFKTYQMVDTLDKFFSFMVCILFWRVIFTLPGLYMKPNKKQTALLDCNLSMLSLRATLAFFSQAAFFFSITRISYAAAWPVLNSGPLIACVIAHFLIKEKLKQPEYITMILFIPMSLLYFIYTWN